MGVYRQLAVRKGNIAFSPFGAYEALAMTYSGARGQTASQMATALHLRLSQQNVPPAFHQLLDWFNEVQSQDNIRLAIANSLWAKREYRFKNSFLELIRSNYYGEARSVDFRDRAAAAGRINEWVKKKTGGEIKDVVGPDQITPNTRLFLCSAIYFDGEWRARFKVKDTSPMPFYLFPSNDFVTVPMMSQFSKFKMTTETVAGGAISMLELPYAGKDVSMIVFAPIDSMLSSLEMNLTESNVENWLAKLDGSKVEKVAVHLPKFNLRQSFDLAAELKPLGLSSLFNADANLSGMDGTTNLYVADAVHKAAIKVDEAGTRAMAATVVRTDTKGMPPEFMADVPFIFLIRDNQSGCILFMGRVTNPLKN